MKFAIKCITKTRDNNDNKIKKQLLYELYLKEKHHLSIESTP